MGLYLAYLLSKKKYKVRIFEANSNAGGHARPFRFSKILIEVFYHFFYKNDHQNAMKWVNSLTKKSKIHWSEIDTEIITKSNNKIAIYNFKDVIKNYTFDSFKIYYNLLIIFFFKIPKSTTSKTAYFWAKKKFGTKFTDDVWKPLLIGKFDKK